jgi:hypothetical protein
MKTIEELLSEIKEDKIDNLSTTSFQLKKDLWEFFQNCQDKIAVEFGTHKGQTTRILSHLFKKVYTVNCNDNLDAKALNSDRNNIVYLNFDLYSNNTLPISPSEPISMFLIDAGHEFEQVIFDINRATSMACAEDCYIVFDDYGCNVHRNSVKRAIDTAIEEKIVTVVKGIGHEAGYNFGTGNKGGEDRILETNEGLITKINWYE